MISIAQNMDDTKIPERGWRHIYCVSAERFSYCFLVLQEIVFIYHILSGRCQIMKKETYRAVTFLITLALIVSSFFSGSISYGEGASVEAASPKTILKDIEGHWGKRYIESAVTAGIITGYEDGTFKPNQAVSRAEFVTMVNKALKLRDENTVKLLFSDVRQTDWYCGEIQKACYARYVNGINDHSFLPRKSITRQEAAVMLSRFLPNSGSVITASLEDYSDSSEISNWAKIAMSLMVKKGYMTGNENGSLLPKGILTRAEAARIISGIIEKETIVRENISVKNAGEILQGKIYVGDITIEKSVGEGDATLESLSALSNVYILGGGVNTVTLKDSIIVRLVVCKEGTKVRVLTDGISVIHGAMVFNDNLIVNNQGQTLDSGEDGFQSIIYFNGSVSAETAIQIAEEIAGRLDSTGRVTTAQVQEGIAAILPDSAAVVTEGDSIVVTLQAAAETEKGNKGSRTRTAATVPGPPTDVRGSVKDGLPAVTFTEPVSNGGNSITSYIVYAYNNGTLAASSSGIAVPVKIAGLTTGSTYQFKAVAVNNAGISTESAVSEPVILSEINGKAALLSALNESHCDCGLSITAGGFEYMAEYYPDIASTKPITGYAIHTEVELQHLAMHKNANAVLLNDLDFTGITAGTADPSTPMGALNAAVNVYGIPYTGHAVGSFNGGKFVPIGIDTSPYTGIFSGNGKRITGLRISGGVDNAGLFGYTFGAEIKDCSLINGNITGRYNVGGAVGYQSGGTVSAVYQTGTITASTGAGGIAGTSNGVIIDCVNAGDISCTAAAGGIVGVTEHGTVDNCFNTGQISGMYNSVGGIAGSGTYKSITDCYNTGSIMGESLAGGIIGGFARGELINNCANSGMVIAYVYTGGITGHQSYGLLRASYNTGPIYSPKIVGGIVGCNDLNTLQGGAGQVWDSFNTGVVPAGTATAVGAVIGSNKGSETGNYWLDGTNLNGTAGVGENITGDTTTTFSAIDPILNGMYASMSAIAMSVGGNGAITEIRTSDDTLPEFNALQGSYITNASSLTVTVSAISDTTVTVSTSTSPEALYLSAGNLVTPTSVSGGSSTYDLSSLDTEPGTWIMIKAVNIDPRLNRSYFIITP